MALLYGMFCSWVVVLRKLASWKHNRLKKSYETAHASFRKIEQDCKNDEVAVGRPAAYSAQLKLMKLYEALDQAKSRWIASKRKLTKRQRMESRIKSLHGRKIPYTFGMFDMAIVLKIADITREAGRLDFNSLGDLVRSLIS